MHGSRSRLYLIENDDDDDNNDDDDDDDEDDPYICPLHFTFFGITQSIFMLGPPNFAWK